jgi:hypothetical protein
MRHLHALWVAAGSPQPEAYQSLAQRKRDATRARAAAFNARYECPAFPGCAWRVQVRRYNAGDLTWGDTTACLLAEGVLVCRAGTAATATGQK